MAQDYAVTVDWSKITPNELVEIFQSKNIELKKYLPNIDVLTISSPEEMESDQYDFLIQVTPIEDNFNAS